MVYPVDMAVDDKGVKHGLTNYGDHAAKEEIMGSDKFEETSKIKNRIDLVIFDDGLLLQFEFCLGAHKQATSFYDIEMN